MKRILVSLLSLLLTFSLLMPIVAEDYIEWNNNTALPEKEGFYKLTEDVTITDSFLVNSNSSITIDLNGHTINAADDLVYKINRNGILIIEDSVGTGKIISQSTTFEIIGADGELVLNGGAIETNGDDPTIDISNGSFQMNGGSITSSGKRVVTIIELSSNTSFTMTNGLIKQEHYYSSNGGVISSGNSDNATINISGGKINSSGKIVYSIRSQVNITGGEFFSNFDTSTSLRQCVFDARYLNISPKNNEDIIVQTNGNLLYGYSGGTILIDGGNYSFDGRMIESGSSTLEIKSGIFSSDVEEFASDDIVQANNGSKFSIGQESTEALSALMSEGDKLTITNAPEGTSLNLKVGIIVENLSGEDIEVNGSTIPNGKTEQVIKPIEPQPEPEKPSKPDHNWVYRPSYNDSKDEEVKEYTTEDKTKACIELLGKGWEYSESNKSCVYTLDSNVSQIPNTSTR